MPIFLTILTLLFQFQLNEKVEALSCYGGTKGAFNNLTLAPCKLSDEACEKRIQFDKPDRVFRSCNPYKNCIYAAKEKSEYISEHYFIGNMICTNITEWNVEDPSKKFFVQECCCNEDGCNQ